MQLCSSTLSDDPQRHLVIPVSLQLGKVSIDTYALVDSGASTVFMDTAWAERHFIHQIPKRIPQQVFAINDTVVPGGTHTTKLLSLEIGKHISKWNMELVQIAHYPLVLGIEWLRLCNPTIDWYSDQLQFRDPPESTVMGLKVGFLDEDSIPTKLSKSTETSEIPAGLSMSATTSEIPVAYLPWSELFKKSNADQLPKHTKYDHSIPIEEGKSPPFGPVYGMSPTELDTLKEYIDDMLSKGFIRKSESPAGAPVIFVKKKEGSLRLCVDYRGLNTITIKNRTPLPLIDETLDRIGQAQVYTRLDLRGAYNLLRMKEGEEWKTAFRTRYGLFEYLVMPFGLTNAPASFQSMINDALRPFLDVFVVVYLDDILIFSNSESEHVSHVQQTLEALSKFDLFVKPEKCEWHVTTTEFLGYVLSPAGISMSKDKVKTILEWPTPKNKHDIQVFMGFCNFYRRFIKNFSGVSKPIYLLTGNTPFEWSTECQQAFDTLKAQFQESPLLQHFDPDRPAILETDASNFALGAILSQRTDDGKLHPVAFYARSLSKAEVNYEIYDKELLSIVEAMKHWRTYLENSKLPTLVQTDHKNLEYFTSTKVLNQRQARWGETLARYNFQIKYIPGHNNKADGLSRRPDLNVHGQLTERPPLLPQKLFIKASFTRRFPDSFSAAYPENIDNLPNPLGVPLKASGGVVYHNNQIYAPPSESIRQEIIGSRHASPTAGHGGTAKTFDLVSREYYWPEMRKDIIKFVNKCDVCQRTKTPRHLPHGYLQPLPTPQTPWSSLSMDFIVKLPLSQGFDSILVVVDRLTKMAHFIACQEATDAEGLAELFLRHIFRIHGLPKDIVSDRGPSFQSKFWRKVLELLQIQSKLSSAFHPETDGQTERVNQCLEQFLRCYVNYQQDDWTTWLPIAEFQYNNSKSNSTGSSPFYANYGFHPRMDLHHEPAPSSSSNPAGESLITRIQLIQKGIQDELTLAKATYKEFADKHRLPGKQYAINDKVYLSNRHLKNYRPSRKLDDRFIGPFSIQKIIGDHSAYQLKLPQHMRVHPIFHPSLLKPASNDENTPPIPEGISSESPQYEVAAILDSRRVGRSIQYLVDWENYGPNERSWEPRSVLLADIPQLLHQFHLANPHRPSPTLNRRS